MTDTDILVLACLHAPLDAGPRLALSDFLEERGWDAFRLAALRGDGYWEVHRDTSAGWWFDARHVVSRLYPGATNLVCYGTAPVVYKLDLGPVPAGGPACHACGCQSGLAVAPPPGKVSATGRGGPDRKWVCGAQACRWPKLQQGAAASTSFTYTTGPHYWLPADSVPSAMWPPPQQLTEAEIRSLLGLPEQPDDE